MICTLVYRYADTLYNEAAWVAAWVVDVACSEIFEGNHTWYIECSERVKIIAKQAEEKAPALMYTVQHVRLL